MLLPGAAPAAGEPAGGAGVAVREAAGLYTITARFEVPQGPAVALAVLTDYEQIPRFMPDVRRSLVLERAPGRVVVEQEAIARMMMFSRRIHLRLEVEEDAHGLRFRDASGTSFTHYEGRWCVAALGSGTAITYELTARPGFDVPGFLLSRLLKRDAVQMIQRLRAEVARRDGSRSRPAGH